MDPQTIINVGLSVIIASLGWFARTVWDAVNELKRDMHQIEVQLPSNYIRRDEYTDFVREIRDMFQRIFDKLDEKADK